MRELDTPETHGRILQMEYEQKGNFEGDFTVDASSKCQLWHLPHRCAQRHPYRPYNPFKWPNLVLVKGLVVWGVPPTWLLLSKASVGRVRNTALQLFYSVTLQLILLNDFSPLCCAMLLIPNFSWTVWGAPLTIWLLTDSCQTFYTFSNRVSFPKPCMRGLTYLAPFSICVIRWQR